jgi:hypothetical protein
MNALDFRTIDKDLPERPRFGKPLEFLRVELEGQCRTRRTVGAGLEIIGPERGFDGVDIAPQDAVIV